MPLPRVDSLITTEQMSVPGSDQVFMIGCLDRQITFYAQQLRAFNLVWALFEQQRLFPGSDVAIVGGGIAGMTVAAAALLKGCRVTLLESTSRLLHLQEGNYTRFVHPNINFWPDEKSRSDSTDLPCLNWFASYAGEVALELVRQWSVLDAGPNLRVFLSSRVEAIERNSDDNPVPIISNKTVPQQPYDCVILAVGFGVERQLAKVPFRSYWDEEPLHQPIKKEPIPRNCLVTGCGDGGLIDTLRLRIGNFRHHQFVHSFLDRKEFTSLRTRLLEIEEEAKQSKLPDDIAIPPSSYIQDITNSKYLLRYSRAFIFVPIQQLP